MSTLKTNSIEPVTHSDPLVLRTNATETMRLATDGNVVVGASSVVSGYSSSYRLLDVAQTTGSGGGVVVTRSNSVVLESGVDQANGGIIGTRTSHPVIFRTGASERMRLTSNGKLGIGTVAPLQPLHIENSSGSEGILLNRCTLNVGVDFGSSSGGWARGVHWLGTTDPVSGITAGLGLYGSGETPIHIYLSNGVNPWTSGTGLYIKTNNDVGIGTTSPTAKVQIDGADGTGQGLFVNLNGTDAATVPTTLAQMWTRAPVHIKGAGTSTTRLLIGGDSNGSALQSSNTNGGGALPLSLQPFGGGLFHNSLPMFACRAWACFNGSGTLLGGANASISKLAVGRFRITYTTALTGTPCVVLGGSNSSNAQIACLETSTATYCDVRFIGGGAALGDPTQGNVVVFA